MTGTAMTEAGEFWKIYKLDVFAIPTNMPLSRLNHPDLIYRSEQEKFTALVDEIERMNKWDVLLLGKDEERLGTIAKETDDEIEYIPRGERQRERIPKSQIVKIERHGRPLLVGTVSIEKSERVSGMLDKRGVKHQVLNAKHHQREAEIIAQAGRKSAVTIATNMAGRGTDIILGGNPEAMAWAQLQQKYPTRLDVPQAEWDQLVQEIEEREQMKIEGREVAAMGGLHVIATERHEARRIDLQLRGRCGRQGDPGSSRFYLSLEDDLMRIFAGEWVKNILTRLGMEEGQAIESRMVTRRIEGAQKKVEAAQLRHPQEPPGIRRGDGRAAEARLRLPPKHLERGRFRSLIFEMIDREINRFLDQFLGKDYAAESFAEWAGSQLGVELDAKEFRGTDFKMAETYALDRAERDAESQIYEAIDEKLPEGEEQTEWNWEDLAKFANVRWKLACAIGT